MGDPFDEILLVNDLPTDKRKIGTYHQDPVINEIVEYVLEHLRNSQIRYIVKTKSGKFKKITPKGVDKNMGKNWLNDQYRKEIFKAVEKSTEKLDGAAHKYLEYVEGFPMDTKDAEKVHEYVGNFYHPTTKEINDSWKSKRSFGNDISSRKNASLAHWSNDLNKKFNCLLDNKYTMMSLDLETMVVMDTSKNYEVEHVFVCVSSKGMYEKNSFFNIFKDHFIQEERFFNDVNLQKRTLKLTEKMKPFWIQTERHQYPQLNLMNGGFIDIENTTARLFDTVEALVAKFEMVLTQEAVRGIGRGSYYKGSQVLWYLMDLYEQQAKQYSFKSEETK